MGGFRRLLVGAGVFAASLAVVVISAVPAAADPPGAIPGPQPGPKFSVVHIETTDNVDCSTFPVCTATQTGSGILPKFGLSTLSSTQTWNWTGDCGSNTITFHFVNVFSWTAANGDRADYVAVGDFCFDFGTNTQVSNCATYTAVGGTGRFADDSGSASFCTA